LVAKPAAIDQTVLPSVLVLRRRGELASQTVLNQRSPDAEAPLIPISTPERHCCGAVPFPRRRRRDHIDGTADRVPAEQGALGTAEYLDALDIEQVECRAGRAAQVNAVEVGTNTRVGGSDEVELTNTSDEVVAGRAALRPSGAAHVGGDGRNIRQVGS